MVDGLAQFTYRCPMRPIHSQVRTVFVAPSGQVDASFQPVNAAPSSYPRPVIFNAPGTDAVWWIFKVAAADNTPYIAWTNGRTVVVKCRELLLRGVTNNERSYDGGAVGSMGPAENGVIDGPMLRRLWTWLKRARSEGRGVVTQALLDLVANSARQRMTKDGLGLAMIIATWHVGGFTGASRFSAARESEVIYFAAPGHMPAYGMPMNPVGSPIQAKVMLNHLDNVPFSDLPMIDSLRLYNGQPPPPMFVPPPPGAPGQSPVQVQPLPPKPPAGSNVIYQYPGQAPQPQIVQMPAPPPVQQGQPAQPVAPALPQPLVPVPGGTPIVRPADSTSPAMLGGSVAEIAKKALPYAIGAVVISGLAYGAYRIYQSQQE